MHQIIRISAWALHLAVLALYLFSLWALFEHRIQDSFWRVDETFQIVGRSLLQALLSASLSTIWGLIAARSFFYLSFKWKPLFYKWLTFAWALPSLVVIFAMIGVWGNNGWLATLLMTLGVDVDFSIYGLSGIVLAHLFLNIPLVMKYCVEGLSLIPSNHHRLASQLGLFSWRYFQIVELPILKGILPYAFGTVFLLCFTSFPIVLMLGGGPKYSTLEVAIYQAVTFEFDFAKAVMLIVVQLIFGAFLQLGMGLISAKAFEKYRYQTIVDIAWREPLFGVYRLISILLLGITSLFIFIPILNVVWNGISALTIERLLQSALLEAIIYSVVISLLSALFVVGGAYLIALESRQLAYFRQKVLQHILGSAVFYPLIFPIFLLAVGLFLLLIDVHLTKLHLIWIIGLCNGLVLLPFVYHLIFSAMWQSLLSTKKLGESLGLKGLMGWWIMEKQRLVKPLMHAFALAFSASFGNFSVIAFFGNPDFVTLPYLLYQQLGNYRIEESAVTSLVLMCLALLPFLFIKEKENW